MSRKAYRYPLLPLLAPWTALPNEAGAVIAARLTLLPWLWLVDPDGAARESRTMVDEKHAAWLETQAALWQAPWRFWLDLAAAGPFALSRAAVEGATARAGRRLAAPTRRRVRANRRRLGADGAMSRLAPR